MMNELDDTPVVSDSLHACVMQLVFQSSEHAIQRWLFELKAC
jgi:hypothetical protein